MEQNESNVVYQPQIGFGTKIYKKVSIANTESKPSILRPVTLVTVRPIGGAQPVNPQFATNSYPLTYQRMSSMDSSGKRASSRTRNEGNLISKPVTISRATINSSKTTQKPLNRTVLTAKNKIPLRKQLKPSNEPATASQVRTNVTQRPRTGFTASNVANAVSGNHGQVRNRSMTLRKRISKDELGKTVSKVQTQKSQAAVAKSLSNQASGDHNQSIHIARKGIPPVRLTAVVNITQGCSDEPPTVGAVLTEVPPTFTSKVMEENGDGCNAVPEEFNKPATKLVTKKKRLTATTPHFDERLKAGSESARSRPRRLRPHSYARSEAAEVKEEEDGLEPVALAELGIQTNEKEITNHSLLVGDTRYISPSASVIAEIEKNRQEERAKNLAQVTRKFSKADQHQEQHIDDLNEFLQQSYISKKPRKVPDMFEADRKLMTSMDIILNREIPKTESITDIKQRIKLKEKELLSLFDNVQPNGRR